MRPTRALAALAFAALVAACSSSAGGAAASASAAPPAASPAAAASSDSKSGYGYGGGDNAGGSPAAAGGIALAKTKLGDVLAGPTGMTLYLFTPDTATSSACTATCAASWPPLTGDVPALGAGLDAADFTTITRPDGTKQVAFYGHPLYYFGGDKAAGDVNGQGLNQKWYVLGADGNPIK